MPVISSTKVRPWPACSSSGSLAWRDAEGGDAARQALGMRSRIVVGGHPDVDLERGGVGLPAHVLQVEEHAVRGGPPAAASGSGARLRATRDRIRGSIRTRVLASSPRSGIGWSLDPISSTSSCTSRSSLAAGSMPSRTRRSAIVRGGGAPGSRSSYRYPRTPRSVTSRACTPTCCRRASARRTCAAPTARRSPEPRGLAGIRVGRVPAVPGLPEPVDVGVVQPEDRVQAGCSWVGHRPGQALVVRVGATDQAVHPVVRLRLDPAVDLARMGEARVHSAEAGAPAAGHAREVGIGHRLEVHEAHGDEHVAVVEGSVPLHHEQGVVPGAVGPVRGRERRAAARPARA